MNFNSVFRVLFQESLFLESFCLWLIVLDLTAMLSSKEGDFIIVAGAGHDRLIFSQAARPPPDWLRFIEFYYEAHRTVFILPDPFISTR